MTTLPIFDGHNDVLLSLLLPERGGERSFFQRSEQGHVDLPRAREGGFAGGFFAMYVPSESPLDPEERVIPTETGYTVPLAPPVPYQRAREVTLEVRDLLLSLEGESNGQVRVVRDADELERCLRDGVLAAVMHMEGAEAIDPELETVQGYYDGGLRSLGLVWSRSNAFGHGVPFEFPRSPDTGPGLTEAGRELVRACNRLGIMIDLSHLNERGFWDVAELTEKPLVATHSNAHALCPITRNLTDRELDAIAESGGMVGVNFAVTMLRPDGRHDENTPLEDVVRHFDYLVERMGIDHVGFGSDFDGATVPAPIRDAGGLPAVVEALRERGYDEPALRQLTHENWVRVLRATWKG